MPAGRTLHITPIDVPGVEHAPHARPGVVADEAADLGLAGRNRVALKRNVHLAVVVAQVAVGRDRPQVDPLADVGVPQEPFVILVGIARARSTASTSPPIRQLGPIVTQPRRLARKSCVSAPIEHGPSIRVNGWTQTFGPERDRPVGRVEDRVRIDPRGLVDPEPIDGPDQGQRRQVPVADADLPAAGEVALADGRRSWTTRSHGRSIHSPPTSEPPCLRRHPLEPGVDALRLERDRVLRARPRHRPAGRRTAPPTDPYASGSSKPTGGTQRLFATITGPRASQSRSLTTMCGSRCRCTANQVRPNQRNSAAAVPGPLQTPAILLASVVAPRSNHARDASTSAARAH